VRFIALTVMPWLCTAMAAQIPEQHFSGALELGAGWGHAIDLTLENNHPSLRFPVSRLLHIPWQGGIHVARDLNPVSCLEFGMLYHRRSSDWVYERSYTTGSGTETETSLMVLALDGIDFSLKYYRFLDYRKNRELYVFGGISPVWVLNVPNAADLTIEDVPRRCFRSWNLALQGGLALERKRLRWKLQLDFCLVSVVNGEYILEVPEEERAWGTRIFPFEALLCCAYLIS
jgi:hypothetical protein